MALARSLSNLTVEYLLEDLPRALECGREGVEVATRAGLAPMISYADINMCLAQMEAGEWAVLDERPSPLASGELVDVTGWAGVEAYLQAARGIAHAVEWPGGEAPASDDPADTSWIAFAESMAAWSRGDGEAALHLGVEAVGLQYELAGVTDDLVHMWPHTVEVAMAVGDDETRERLIAMLDEAAAKQRIAVSLRAHRSRVDGLLARGRDDGRVEPQLRHAIEGFTTWGARPYRARTQAELGLWLTRSGRSDEGAALLAPAKAYLTELRATGWLEQLLPASTR